MNEICACGLSGRRRPERMKNHILGVPEAAALKALLNQSLNFRFRDLNSHGWNLSLSLYRIEELVFPVILFKDVIGA